MLKAYVRYTPTAFQEIKTGGHSHWEVIWVCAAYMTHLFTLISSSDDPQFHVNLQLRSPNSQFSPKEFKSLNRLKSSDIGSDDAYFGIQCC